jgi:predicted ATPase
MTFLKEISLKPGAELDDQYPFTLPVIESLDTLDMSSPVTFFVGENGSGKSTVLEAIAAGLKCPSLGAIDTARDPMLEDARTLAAAMTMSRSKTPRNRLFFRAEDAIGFTRRIMENMSDLDELEAHFDSTLSGYGRQLATGATRGQREALKSRYGDNPDARSHGEWFLAMLKSRVHPKGLYLLDEPETPLSPIHQLTLLSLIKDWASQECQFIVATHSPILMALPGARIYAFDQRIEEVAWDEVEHVTITRQFLNDPEGFLRHL